MARRGRHRRVRLVRRLTALGCALVLVIFGVSLVRKGSVAGAADAAPTWSVAMPYIGHPVVAPTGDVIASSCTPTSGATPDPLQFISRAGDVKWTVPASATLTPNCAGPNVVADAQGNTYVFASNTTTNEGFVESFSHTGAFRWATSTGTYSSATSMSPVLGGNQSVYFGLFNGAGNKVFGFNEATGTATTENFPSGEIHGIYPYPNGLAVVVGDGEVDYVPSDGSAGAQYRVGAPISSGQAYSSGGAADGSVFLAGYNGSCGGKVSIAKVTPTGLAWVWTDTNDRYCSQTALAATPDGGVILAGDESLPTYASDFTSIDAAGHARWTHHATDPGASDPFPGGYFAPVVDQNGIVVLPTEHRYSCGVIGTCIETRIEFVSQQQDSPALPTLDLTDSTNGSYEINGLAIDTGRLYVTRDTRDLPSSIPPVLVAFDVGGLGKDYRMSLEVPDYTVSGLAVNPQSGLPGTQFTANWSCPDGNASIEITNNIGNPVLPGQLPVTGNGLDYSDAFIAAIPPGGYTVTASCAERSLSPVKVTILAASYVSLGDSFASGEGATSYFPSTDRPDVDMCHRATEGYAARTARQLGYSYGSAFDFAACSGAVIPDLYGQNSRNSSEIAQALHLSASTKTITISIGGNDVGFSSVLQDCLSLPPIDGLVTHSGGPGCAKRDSDRISTSLNWLVNGRAPGCYQLPGIDGMTGHPKTVCGALPSLSKVYRDLHASAPNARILVLGYPNLWGSKFVKHQDTCNVLNVFGQQGTINKTDADWMNKVGTELNKIISNSVGAAATAASANIQFVPVNSTFDTHRFCDTKGLWFNPVFLDHAGTSVSMDQGSMHPNDTGQQSGYFAALSPKL